MAKPNKKKLQAIIDSLRKRSERSMSEQQFAELKQQWLDAGGTEDEWVAATDQMAEM